MAAVGLGTACGLRLPHRIGWRQLIVIALATSSGFTFALFVAAGTIPIGPVLAQVKFGALSTVVGAAATVGAALVGVITFGSLAGSMLPFLLRRLGFDPAVSSAPFVATLVDVTGLVIYFSVAFVILHRTLL